MLSESMQAALNDQLALEQSSAHQYLGMSAWCEAKNLPGSAAWLRTQSEEEREHAMKIYHHIVDCGGEVQLRAIEAPRSEFSSALDVFEASLAQERGVSASIHALYEQAQNEKDYPTQVMLQWFITEQVEEEASITGIVEQIRMVGENSTSLFFIDRHLGKRRGDEG
jgi:ferritin